MTWADWKRLTDELDIIAKRIIRLRDLAEAARIESAEREARP